MGGVYKDEVSPPSNTWVMASRPEDNKDPVLSQRKPEKLASTRDVPPTEVGKSAAAALPLTFAPGDMVADRYRVENLIGHGGMGAVYEVENVFMKKRFALKVLHVQTDSSVRRFQMEAKAASRLDHPNLLKVHDFGLLAGQHPYLLMDLEHGVPLSAVIEKSPLSYNAVLNIFRQICSGLSYAHSASVIHRDIKPSNIVVSKPDDLEHTDIVIVDFGIAKLTTNTPVANQLTHTGELVGTPYYMSPEQCLGQTIDRRSDIYSVGCVLFECLTAAPPFTADSPFATMMMHQSATPPTLAQATMGESFPAGLQLVIDKLLEKKPEKRYQNLLDLDVDLELIKAGAPPLLSETGTPKVSPNRKLHWPMIVVGAIALVMSALCAILIMNWPKAAKPSSAFIVKNNSSVGQENIGNDKSARADLLSLESKQQADDLHTLLQRKTLFSSPLPDNPTSRLFEFPEDRRLLLADVTVMGTDSPVFLKQHGDFILSPAVEDTGFPTRKTELSARGIFLVQNFKGLAVRPTELLCNHPELFDLFRADDVVDLNVNTYTYEWKDGDLRCLRKFPNMVGIELAYADNLTDEALNTISSKQHLKKLCISVNHMSDKALSNFSGIRRLLSVKLSNVRNLDVILNVLKGSPNTRLLSFNNCKFTREDAELLATLPALGLIDIGNTNTLTTNELAPLARARLYDLSLGKVQLTPEFIAILKSMHLKKLEARLTPSECDRLSRILRPTEVDSAQQRKQPDYLEKNGTGKPF